MNFWNEDKKAWAGLPEKVKRGIESGPLERLNDEDAWEPGTGRLESNGVHRVKPYDWTANPESRVLDTAPDAVKDRYVEAWQRGDLEFQTDGGWRSTAEYEPRLKLVGELAYRVKPYDWTANPKKRPLRDNESMRKIYEDARRQGNLEFWFRGVWLEDRLAGEDPTLDNEFAYRLKPIDTSNPDWIVWGKMDERVRDAILNSGRIQRLTNEGEWEDNDNPLLYHPSKLFKGFAYRTAP